MRRILSDEALDILFRTGRRPEAWLNQPIGETLLRAVWELAKRGPVSPKALPVRALFIRSPKAKQALAQALPADGGAVAWKAPVTAILAANARGNACGLAGRVPVGAEARAQAAAEGSLCGGYLLLAARALGLDCRPIWDFEPAALESAFFPEGGAMASFVCALGCGDDAQPGADPPDPAVGEACRFL
jgi:3-hydroxypropanoate dehydrogenase